MNAKTISEHYVPKFYLQMFQNENKTLFCYFKDKKYIRPSTARKICVENNLYEVPWMEDTNNDIYGKYVYENKIEQYFANFENESAPIIRDIIKKLELNKTNPNAVICNKKEKTYLISIIANFILRNPAMMNENNRKKEIERLCSKEKIKEISQLFEKEFNKSIKPLVEYEYKRSLIDHNYDIGYAKKFMLIY